MNTYLNEGNTDNLLKCWQILPKIGPYSDLVEKFLDANYKRRIQYHGKDLELEH